MHSRSRLTLAAAVLTLAVPFDAGAEGFRARVGRAITAPVRVVKGWVTPKARVQTKARPAANAREYKQLAHGAKKAANKGDFSAALGMLKQLEQKQARRGLIGRTIDGARRARAYNKVAKKIATAVKAAASEGKPIGKVWSQLRTLEKTRGARRGLVDRLMSWGRGMRLAGVERSLINDGARLSRSHQHAVAHKYFQLSRKVRRLRGKRGRSIRFRVSRWRAKRRMLSGLESPRSLGEAQLNIKLLRAYAKEDGRKLNNKQLARAERGYVNGMAIDAVAGLEGRVTGKDAGELASRMINQAKSDRMLTPTTVKAMLKTLKAWTKRGQRIQVTGEAARLFKQVAKRDRGMRKLVTGSRLFGNGYVTLRPDVAGSNKLYPPTTITPAPKARSKSTPADNLNSAPSTSKPSAAALAAMKTLGAKPGESYDAVKHRKKALAMANHPDRGGDGAQITKIVEAWKTIDGEKDRLFGPAN